MQREKEFVGEKYSLSDDLVCCVIYSPDPLTKGNVIILGVLQSRNIY